ncbi:MAG TPA: STAS domain-containing protein [Acidimicrobiales bacterium]|nr:STAS domain-containing protein [Acidimicrobiales bacterium]
MDPGAASPAPGSAFTFDITRDMGVVVVTAHGRLDATSGATLRAVLVDLIEGQGNLRVVVDLHAASVVDPSIVEVLVAASASATRRGGELTFTDPSDCLLATLEAIGLASAATVAAHRRLRSLPPPPVARIGRVGRANSESAAPSREGRRPRSLPINHHQRS